MSASAGADVFERTRAKSAEDRWAELKSQYLRPAAARPQPIELTRPGRPLVPAVTAGLSRSVTERPQPVIDTLPGLSDAAARWRPTAIPRTRPAAVRVDETSLRPIRAEAQVEPEGRSEDGDALKDLLDEAREEASETDEPAVDEGGGPDDADDRPTIEERVAEAARLRPLSTIVPTFDYAPAGVDRCTYVCPRPGNCPEGDEESRRCPELTDLPPLGQTVRVFAPASYAWAASNLTYNPLYFEDADLERYGHHYPEWVQPFASGGLFAVQVAALPYQMAIDPPCACVSPLGFHRPGECVPTRKKAVPWNPRAAAKAAGVYTGLIFLVP